MGLLSKLFGGGGSSSSSAPVTTSSNYEDSRIGASDEAQAVGASGIGAKDSSTVIDLDGGSVGSVVTNDPASALAAIESVNDTARTALLTNAAISDLALNANVESTSKALDEAYNATRWQQNFSTEQQSLANDLIKKSVATLEAQTIQPADKQASQVYYILGALASLWLIFKK